MKVLTLNIAQEKVASEATSPGKMNITIKNGVALSETTSGGGIQCWRQKHPLISVVVKNLG
jgi:hypothetical protein